MSSESLGRSHTAWIGTEDFTAWLTLFRASFGVDMSEAFWRWKYRGLDAIGVAAFMDDEMIAFYGGMPREVSWVGTPIRLVQIGDVMVHPRQRGILTRKGPFWQIATRFLDERCDALRPDRYRCAFGFPNEKHMRLGERLGLYRRAGGMTELSWSPTPPRTDLFRTFTELDVANLKDIDRLWSAMARDLSDSIVPQRDARHVARRYLEHPENPYRLLMLRNRLGGGARGLAVLRNRGAEGLDLVDIVAPLADMPAVVEHARRYAHVERCHRLFCWISSHKVAVLAGNTERVVPLDMSIALSIRPNAPNIDTASGGLWMMSGDTDFR